MCDSEEGQLLASEEQSNSGSESSTSRSSSPAATMATNSSADESSDKDNKFVKKLDLTASNVAAQWKTFKSQFSIYQVAKAYSKMESEDIKIANMLLLMGRDCVPIYDQFTFSTTVETQKKTLENVIKMFDDHFEPVKNIIYERVKFNNIKQEPNQSIHQFIVAVQTQAANCDYGEPIVNELIRDRIVVGVRDSSLRDYLIDIDDLDLPKCIQKAKQYVSFHAHTQQMAEKSSSDNLDSLSSMRNSTDKDQKKMGKSQQDQKLDSRCNGCGRFFHRKGKCPAAGVECFKCGKANHFSRMCKQRQKVNEMCEDSASCSEAVEDLFLGDSL